MARKSSLEKEHYWREILRRQASSDLSVRKFCLGEGISEPSFYAWRKRLRKRPRGDAGNARRLQRREDATGNSELFVPLKLVDMAATLEIVHPLGYRVQVGGEVNPVALRQVIEILDQRGAR